VPRKVDDHRWSYGKRGLILMGGKQLRKKASVILHPGIEGEGVTRGKIVTPRRVLFSPETPLRPFTHQPSRSPGGQREGGGSGISRSRSQIKKKSGSNGERGGGYDPTPSVVGLKERKTLRGIRRRDTERGRGRCHDANIHQKGTPRKKGRTPSG